MAGEETEAQIAQLFITRDRQEKELRSIDHEINALIKIYSREQGYIVPLSVHNMRLLIESHSRKDNRNGQKKD